MARIITHDTGPFKILKHMNSTLILLLVTIVLIVSVALWIVRINSVSGEEIGIKVNNLTGNIEKLGPGTHWYWGIINNFYIMDKRLQEIEMVAESGRGEIRGNDELEFKTVDGSNLALDLNVFYQLDLSAIETVVHESGVPRGFYKEDPYKRKWVRDFARSICRDQFGELTTEEFYDASKRASKALEAQDELNRRLNPHGLIISSINPEDFRFDEQYSAKIREKKTADQEVEEQESVARAKRQELEKMRVQATKQKDVAIESFTGAMRETIVTAEAVSQKTRDNADGYAIKTRIEAEGQLTRLSNGAKAILAERKVVAEGLAQLARALTGEGGRNIVKMEYANKLTQMKITGKPFTINGQTERFAHTEEGAARSAVKKINVGKVQ
jgi:regulator of protease activity HflC (stomatin/prohibitin superfamily)